MKLKINLFKRAFALGIITLFLISFVSAFGISSPYWEGHPLRLLPGESADFSLGLQNMVGSDDLTIRAAIVDEDNILEFTDASSEYFVPIRSDNVRVNLKVNIPESDQIGKAYRVGVYFQPIASGEGPGNVQIITGIEKSFDVVVAGKDEERFVVEQPVQSPEESSSSTIFYIIGLLFLAMLITLIVFYLKKTKADSESNK